MHGHIQWYSSSATAENLPNVMQECCAHQKSMPVALHGGWELQVKGLEELCVRLEHSRERSSECHSPALAGLQTRGATGLDPALGNTCRSQSPAGSLSDGRLSTEAGRVPLHRPVAQKKCLMAAFEGPLKEILQVELLSIQQACMIHLKGLRQTSLTPSSNPRGGA